MPVPIAFDEKDKTSDAATGNEWEEDETDEFDQCSDKDGRRGSDEVTSRKN